LKDNKTSENIKSQVEEDKKDEEKYDLDRETLLLDLMKFNYINEDKRNSDLDNKSSSLIAFLGVMLTIQATMGVNVIDSLKDVDYIGYVVILFIISLIFYGLSILLFILAYKLKEFKSAPVADQLYKYGDEGSPQVNIVIEVTGNLRNSINHNEKILDNKAKYMKAGFITLLLGILFTIMFISVLLSIIT